MIDLGIPKFVLESGITKEDVWGKYDEDFNLVSKGMVVASAGELCPVTDVILPSKSVAVTCKKEQASAVYYWLEYVLGPNCIRKTNENSDLTITIRADYKCW